MVDVLVMAGGGKAGPLTDQEGITNKAFIPLNGKPMLAYILEGLSAAPSINRIVVVGPAHDLIKMQQAGYSFVVVPEVGTMLENAAAGMEEVEPGQLCLVVTADIPLLDNFAVEEFLKLCEPLDADFYYPILTRESCESRFPETKRTYVQLKDGVFTGGNVILMNPVWFLKYRHRLEKFITYRKKPLKLLRMFPPFFMLKYLFRCLTVADLENKLSQLLQLKARAIPCDLSAIGTDVDKLSDLTVVRKALQEAGTRV